MSEELEVAPQETMGETPGENTSGQGKESVLPDELKGWNWGAFLLNWIWGLFNRTPIALLMFIPFVNLVWGFVLGAKGNKWAWANKSWDDVDHFRRVQRKWAVAGVIVLTSFTVLFLGGAGYGIWAFNHSDIRVMAVQETQRHPDALKVLGGPIEPHWWTGGDISRDGEGGGNADITFSVTGPKGEGRVRATGVLKGGKWLITRMSLYDAAEKEHPLVKIMAASGDADKGLEAYKKGDYAAALKIWKPLAEQGKADAQYNLGGMYYKGTGVPQDSWEASRWFRRAAQQGFALAQANLGLMYKNGEWGTPQHDLLAHQWLNLAAKSGLEAAAKNRDLLEKSMTPEQIATAKDMADQWMPVITAPPAQMSTAPGKAPPAEKLAEKTDEKTGEKTAPAAAVAAKPLDLEGVREAIGRGETKKSVPRLRFLASQGNPDAQLLLGDLFMEGLGIYQNYSMAGNWYKKAARSGSADSQFKLAGLYQKGLGVPLYIGRGRELLIRAAKQGHAQAIESLKKRGIEPPPMMLKEADDSRDGKGKGNKAGKDESADPLGMDIKIAGMEPAAGEVAPAVMTLVESFADAVNSKDLAKLKTLMGPEYAACANEGNKAVYDQYLSDGMGFDIGPGYAVSFGTLNPGVGLPFLDIVSYPVRPGHYVQIDLASQPPMAGQKKIEYGTTIIQPLVNADGQWSLAFGCPTPLGIQRMRKSGMIGEG